MYRKRDVRLAQHAGFCYGVRRAVDMVEEALRQGGDVATLGHVIHNRHVVEGFAQRGVRIYQDAGEALPGERVVIRSHGQTKEQRETLDKSGAVVVDATCPCVRRIQGLVAQAKGQVVLLGERDHPEVRSAASYASGQVAVVEDAAQARLLPDMDEVLLVAQTTARHEIWEETVAVMREKARNLTAVCTICGATKERQDEAAQLASNVDAMLVIGDPNSSNTRKLRALCADIAPTWAIQDASEIPKEALESAQVIGITAGASTPDEIIKEVVTYMSELDNKTNQDVLQAQDEIQEPAGGDSSNFMAEFEKTLVSIKSGQIVTGKVVQITENEVCVNIGYKSDGIIPRAELIGEGDPRDTFKVEDEVEVEVVKVNDGEGNVLLSQRNVLVLKNWDILVEQSENDQYVEGIGKSVVKGGLICEVMGVRTFVPASQLAERYVEKIEQFVGQTMKLKIIEVDRSKRRLVGSRKAALIEESKKIKEEIWGKLAVGDVIEGIVRRLTDFGAFVDIGGIDGLVHVTDLAWNRVKHPSDVVKPDDQIKVVVLGLDRERERISLGYKQLQTRPWDNAAINYPVGSIVEGKVVRMVTFGAFVELESGLDGLVHISQISPQRIAKVEDALQVGQLVNVKVLDVNTEQRRISLSIREAIGVEGQHDALDELPSDLDEAVLAMSSDNLPGAEPVQEQAAEEAEPQAEAAEAEPEA